MTGIAVSWITLIAIYFVVWWICLFIILPFGVRTQDEEEDTILGTVGSAPIRPMLMRKALATTVLAAVVVAVLWLAADLFDVSLDSISRTFG